MGGAGRPERRGRPREQRSEVLAETAKVLRDRILTREDQTNKLNRSLTQRVSEAEVAQDTLPEAAVAVLGDTEAEVKAKAGEIAKVQDEL
eukprot:1392424-Alexandrium_andersonii.AAC.1